MKHDDARRILLGLSDNPTRNDRAEAIDIVLKVTADREVTIPFPERRYATIRLPQPFTAEDWAYMHTVLEAMRPGLISTPPETDGSETGGNR